jgi:hypothetical protein
MEASSHGDNDGIHDDDADEPGTNELTPRPLTEPAPSRLPADTPRRADILARHAAALAGGDAGYLDLTSGLFVLTAGYLADRGYCCERGCRHCPYVES